MTWMGDRVNGGEAPGMGNTGSMGNQFERQDSRLRYSQVVWVTAR